MRVFKRLLYIHLFKPWSYFLEFSGVLHWLWDFFHDHIQIDVSHQVSEWTLFVQQFLGDKKMPHNEYEWPQMKAAYKTIYFIPNRKDPRVLYETGELLFYYISLLFVWLFTSHSFCIYTQCMTDFMLP